MLNEAIVRAIRIDRSSQTHFENFIMAISKTPNLHSVCRFAAKVVYAYSKNAAANNVKL
jgi:hypothetical protein